MIQQNYFRAKQKAVAALSRAAAAAEPAAAAAEPAAKSAQSRRTLREATARAVPAHFVIQPFRSQPVPGRPELKRGLGLEWNIRSASRNAASLRDAIS